MSGLSNREITPSITLEVVERFAVFAHVDIPRKDCASRSTRPTWRWSMQDFRPCNAHPLPLTRHLNEVAILLGIFRLPQLVTVDQCCIGNLRLISAVNDVLPPLPDDAKESRHNRRATPLDLKTPSPGLSRPHGRSRDTWALVRSRPIVISVGLAGRIKRTSGSLHWGVCWGPATFLIRTFYKVHVPAW